mmetsp:Transcript_19740/g.19853  ORF Transcript_19740/g.19853 Transcript_19740/m.19853 type:complete len:183 (-) Transcript_19740:129-677(-)|eukprot:CAMPEP_0182419270 /NCGR_PEP_ID=MMETSP1167-20130531/3718_1 /TAXON_ID=2988 /ORGANISM="Mallomonas Sp, Strain CCMP3275" /LENGTH=182 /DNA_ID=CAMNT_0024594057 /DNA_START=83 /DNA_END=631 /DNA_ORIENTATION=+
MSEVLVPYVKSLIVLDADGTRLLAKYYDPKPKSEQSKFEATLHKKSKAVAAKTDAEVVLFDQDIVVYRSGADCKFFICGPVEENELILVGVLDVIYDTVSALLRGQIDKRTMLDNLELVLLTIDEALDHGHIMELDASAVSSRVLMKGSDSGGPVAIGDLSISQALGMAKDQFMRSLKPRPT